MNSLITLEEDGGEKDINITAVEDVEQEKDYSVEGQVGKGKGLEQVFYECGLFDKSMNLDRIRQRLE